MCELQTFKGLSLPDLTVAEFAEGVQKERALSARPLPPSSPHTSWLQRPNPHSKPLWPEQDPRIAFTLYLKSTANLPSVGVLNVGVPGYSQMALNGWILGAEFRSCNQLETGLCNEMCRQTLIIPGVTSLTYNNWFHLEKSIQKLFWWSLQ